MRVLWTAAPLRLSEPWIMRNFNYDSFVFKLNRRTERLVHNIFHSINHSEGEEIDFGNEINHFRVAVIRRSTYDGTFEWSASQIELPVDHEELQL